MEEDFWHGLYLSTMMQNAGEYIALNSQCRTLISTPQSNSKRHIELH